MFQLIKKNYFEGAFNRHKKIILVIIIKYLIAIYLSANALCSLKTNT